MRKFVSFIMASTVVFGLAGCATANHIDKGDTPESEDIYLARPQTADTVYGVETPSSTQALAVGDTVFQQVAAVTASSGQSQSQQQEMRGIWLSYINMQPMMKGKSKAQFTQNINAAFKNISDFGFNTVFVQVRPFGDAVYKSQYFPWSYTITGVEGQDPGYDPLAIMCDMADQYGLRIEAWVNPYRIRTAGNNNALSSDNMARKWRAAGNDAVLEWNGGTYYNPGSASARQLIVNGAKELVERYNVDGVHFDDYFYPTTDMAFDQATYKASGSKLSQDDWRRENVNQLVREVYAAIKAADANCVFGISPQGSMKNNYNTQFIDVEKWLSNTGYVDYILPQIYYGYQNDTLPYAQTVQEWNNMIKVDGIDLYVGLAAYKIGQEDQWAGKGKNEWVNASGILANMVSTAREQSNYGGCAIYSYDSIFSTNTKQVDAECAKLKKLFE